MLSMRQLLAWAVAAGAEARQGDGNQQSCSQGQAQATLPGPRMPLGGRSGPPAGVSPSLALLAAPTPAASAGGAGRLAAPLPVSLGGRCRGRRRRGRARQLLAAVGAELAAHGQCGVALRAGDGGSKVGATLRAELAAHGDVLAAVGTAHLGLGPTGHGLLEHAGNHHADPGAGAQAQAGRRGAPRFRCRSALAATSAASLARSPMACAALNWKYLSMPPTASMPERSSMRFCTSSGGVMAFTTKSTICRPYCAKSSLMRALRPAPSSSK